MFIQAVPVIFGDVVMFSSNENNESRLYVKSHSFPLWHEIIFP